MIRRRNAPALAGARGSMNSHSWRIDEGKPSKAPQSGQCQRTNCASLALTPETETSGGHR